METFKSAYNRITKLKLNNLITPDEALMLWDAYYISKFCFDGNYDFDRS